MTILSSLNDEIPKPTAQPTDMAIQVLIIYFIRCLSDQTIDGMDDATNAMRMEYAAPRVP